MNYDRLIDLLKLGEHIRIIVNGRNEFSKLMDIIRNMGMPGYISYGESPTEHFRYKVECYEINKGTLEPPWEIFFTNLSTYRRPIMPDYIKIDATEEMDDFLNAWGRMLLSDI